MTLGADGGRAGLRSLAESLVSEPSLQFAPRRAMALLHIAEHPGASNRQIANAIGIADEGQASKLLRRLENLGLATNRSAGHEAGEPNSWHLTNAGAQLAKAAEQA
jgi:DNA-binding MarR family transcriptional regulator